MKNILTKINTSLFLLFIIILLIFLNCSSLVELKEFPKVSAPQFSLTEGEYNNSVEIEIKCDTDDSTILYTIDGSGPSIDNAYEYKGSIEIFQTTTLMAVAVKDLWKDSEINASRYYIHNGKIIVDNNN